MRKPTGNTYESRGKHYARVTVGKARRSFRAASATDAEALAALFAPLARRLVDAGHEARATTMLGDIAASTGSARAARLRVVEELLSGARAPKVERSSITVGELAAQWTSGALARRFPDRIKVKRSRAADVSRLANHILPAVKDVAIADFTLDHAEDVLAKMPASLSPETRRHVARLLARLLSLAVFPLRILATSPLPRRWIPSGGPAKAKAWIYPDEDRKLLACTKIPIRWRIFWGFLAREGMRVAEACALDRADVDLERGVVTLDKNKTDDPRAWALSSGVAEAIAAWLHLREDDAEPLFLDHHGERVNPRADLAKRFRGHLRRAGVTRPELYEKGPSRVRIRAHDLRGTFVTIAAANGKSETWITDRTGHRSSGMVRRYQRAARTAAELGLGDLCPLVKAIPELRAASRKGGGKGGSVNEGNERAGNTGRGAIGRMAMIATRDGSTGPDSRGSVGSSGPSNPRLAGAAADSPPIAGRRSDMAVQLAEQLVGALRLGDLEVAKIAHEALGRLLGHDDARGHGVVDLGARRRGGG